MNFEKKHDKKFKTMNLEKAYDKKIKALTYTFTNRLNLNHDSSNKKFKKTKNSKTQIHPNIDNERLARLKEIENEIKELKLKINKLTSQFDHIINLHIRPRHLL